MGKDVDYMAGERNDHECGHEERKLHSGEDERYLRQKVAEAFKKSSQWN